MLAANHSGAAPKVSVCVVTYNQERYIAQCLDSILSQSADFEFEVIVADDCSTDRTGAIVAEIAARDPRVRVLSRTVNVGPGPNYAEAHEAARGEYVCHMDGDDVWLPGKLRFQASFLDSHPGYVQCWTCASLITDSGAPAGVFPSRVARALNPRTLMSADIALSYALVGQHSTHMYRRAARRPAMLSGTPLDYWAAFTTSLSGKSYYAREIYSCYRLTGSASVTRSHSSRKPTVDLLAQHLVEIFRNYPEYREEALAHLALRKIVSQLRGHDCTVVSACLAECGRRYVSPLLLGKSLVFFMAQKARL